MDMIAAKAGANQQVAAGSYITLQGQKAKNLVLLQKGSVGVYLGSRHSQVRVPLYQIPAPAVLGADALFQNENYASSLVCREECVVSVYAGNSESLEKIFAAKASIASMLLRSVYREITEVYKRLQPAADLLVKLNRSFDNYALAYSCIDPAQYPFLRANSSDNLGFEDPVIKKALAVAQAYQNNEGVLPPLLQEDFFAEDHSALTASFSGLSSEPASKTDLLLMRRLLSLPAELQQSLLQTDPALAMASAKKLSEMFRALWHEFGRLFEQSLDLYQSLFDGDYCFQQKLALQAELAGQNMATAPLPELKALLAYSQELPALAREFSSFWRVKPPEQMARAEQKISSGLAALAEVALPGEEVEEESEQVDFADLLSAGDEAALPADAAAGGEEGDEEKLPEVAVDYVLPPVNVDAATRRKILEDTRGAAGKIFKWCGTSEEMVKEFETLMTELKAMANPMDSDDTSRKLRRKINHVFWATYEAGALKYIESEGKVPKLLQLFFKFGFLDESLLEEEQIVYLYAQSDTEAGEHPVHYMIEWLELVYHKKVPTSVNELGVTFFEVLRQENRDAKWKREEDVPGDIDTSEARLRFELKNMVETTTRLCSGSISNYFALLNKYAITRPMEKAYISKKRMCSAINKLLQVDFSAYHREVLYSNEEMGINREFVQVQVLPNIILAPVTGHIFQYWQEREGKDRLSPGRLVSPALAIEDIYHMLLNATAAYRWEMTKTTMGIDWNNISQSSLTADYVDYVQFFRKNKDLSTEAKEKLSVEFKRYRDDRARFVHDYTLWVMFESEGKQKFNKVARKIFAKHIPFAKPIRENLLKQPLFTDAIEKSINIRKKKCRDMEPRYRKYRNDNAGQIPPELEETFKFYNMEY